MNVETVPNAVDQVDRLGTDALWARRSAWFIAAMWFLVFVPIVYWHTSSNAMQTVPPSPEKVGPPFYGRLPGQVLLDRLVAVPGNLALAGVVAMAVFTYRLARPVPWFSEDSRIDRAVLRVTVVLYPAAYVVTSRISDARDRTDPTPMFAMFVGFLLVLSLHRVVLMRRRQLRMYGRIYNTAGVGLLAVLGIIFLLDLFEYSLGITSLNYYPFAGVVWILQCARLSGLVKDAGRFVDNGRARLRAAGSADGGADKGDSQCAVGGAVGGAPSPV